MVDVDIWLRGADVAVTCPIVGAVPAADRWTDDDVRTVLAGMLEAMYRLKHPNQDPGPIALRGLSWIVNPFEQGGVLIALEISMGAAVAGPFLIDQTALEAMIRRVLGGPALATTGTVH